jgi:hypothetical protein
VREMSITENYEAEITPIRSNISRFSRGTMPRVCWEEQLCVSCEFVTKFAVYGFFAEHSGFPRRSSRQEAPETTIPISLDLRHPSVLLAWSGAQPCEARRAERLGRSGGPSQRRARHGGGQLGGALLQLAADRLMPRMVCRRRCACARQTQIQSEGLTVKSVRKYC